MHARGKRRLILFLSGCGLRKRGDKLPLNKAQRKRGADRCPHLPHHLPLLLLHMPKAAALWTPAPCFAPLGAIPCRGKAPAWGLPPLPRGTGHGDGEQQPCYREPWLPALCSGTRVGVWGKRKQQQPTARLSPHSWGHFACSPSSARGAGSHGPAEHTGFTWTAAGCLHHPQKKQLHKNFHCP